MAKIAYPTYGEPKEVYRITGGRILVSENLTYKEIACKCGRDECRKTDWSQMIHPRTVEFFELLRSRIGNYVGHEVPLVINSGGRCSWYQKHLAKLGYPAAKISPHVPLKQSSGEIYFTALDYAIPLEITFLEFYNIIRDLNYDVRIGHKKYHNRFFHLDFAFLMDPNPKPNVWKEGVEW